MLAKPDPADWLMWRRTLDSWGYSPLNQITRANVANLKLVWTRGMAEGTQEGTPLVHDGVMYLPNPAGRGREDLLDSRLPLQQSIAERLRHHGT